MNRRFLRAFSFGLLFLALGGARCVAQATCPNSLIVKGVTQAGAQETVTILLQRRNVEYDVGTKEQMNITEKKDMGPSCQFTGDASWRQNCAGYVLDRMWHIGVYGAAVDRIRPLVEKFGEPRGKGGAFGTDLSDVRAGDLVFYGRTVHVAYVTSVDKGVVTIDSKDNDGAYFRFIYGQERSKAESKWGGWPPEFFHIDEGRILSHAKESVIDKCPPPPAYKFTCPASATVECVQAVPPPDYKKIKEQLAGCRGNPDAGLEWITQWSVDVKSKDADNGASGRPGDPRKITRTYSATVFYEKQTGENSYALEPIKISDCAQEFTVSDKTPPEFVELNPLSVQCERDIPAPQPGYRERAADNCGGEVQVRHAGDTVVGGLGCKGNPKIIRRAFQSRDASGNMSQAVQMIRVENTSPPKVVSGQSELNLRQGQPIPAPDPRSIVAVDVCTGANMNVTWVKDQVVRQGSGRTGDPLIKNRTYRVSDACGNRMDLVQTIRVEGGAPVEASGGWAGQWVDAAWGTVTTITVSGNTLKASYLWREADDGKPDPHRAAGEYEGTIQGNTATCSYKEEYTDREKDWHRTGSIVMTLEGDTIRGTLTLPEGKTTGTWHIPIDPKNPPLTPKSGNFPFTLTRKR